MLILIAGATGNLGKNLTRQALAHGHKVRVLARDSSKLPSDLADKIEGSVKLGAYDDVPALDRACAGVDAVICAYAGQPTLQLEGQLLLLRAAERANVKRYVAQSWCYDFRNLTLGDHENYDAFLAFRTHAANSSTIRPNFIFTGVFAEVFYAVPGNGDFSPKNHGIWDPEKKAAETYGTGDEEYCVTTIRDAAEYTIHILESENAEQGGYWKVRSARHSVRELCEIYGRVRGIEVPVHIHGSLEQLRETAMEARAKGDKRQAWSYIGYFYQLFTISKFWDMPENDNAKFPDSCRTSIEDFLKQHPDV